MIQTMEEKETTDAVVMGYWNDYVALTKSLASVFGQHIDISSGPQCTDDKPVSLYVEGRHIQLCWKDYLASCQFNISGMSYVHLNKQNCTENSNMEDTTDESRLTSPSERAPSFLDTVPTVNSTPEACPTPILSVISDVCRSVISEVCPPLSLCSLTTNKLEDMEVSRSDVEPVRGAKITSNSKDRPWTRAEDWAILKATQRFFFISILRSLCFITIKKSYFGPMHYIHLCFCFMVGLAALM